MLVDDIPTLELYNIRLSGVNNLIEKMDSILTIIEREIDFISKIGGKYVEKFIVANFS